MATAEIVLEILGGLSVLQRSITNPDEMRIQIRDGLPYASLETVMRKFRLAREEISAALDLPPRTLSRRRREHRLRAGESDRLYRLARVAARAVEVLGNEDRASQWLHRPNRALGGHPPLELLDTDLGSRQVDEILGRIEHGVYS